MIRHFPKHPILPRINAALKRAGPRHIPHPNPFFSATITMEEKRCLLQQFIQAREWPLHTKAFMERGRTLFSVAP